MMAEEKRLNFELVSPERRLVSKPVYMAVMPGMDGQFGAGKDHAALVSALDAGVIETYENSLSDKPKRYFIAGGFADVTADSCTILAEDSTEVENLDADVLQSQLDQYRSDLNDAVEEADKLRFSKLIYLTAAKLEAATGKPVARQ